MDGMGKHEMDDRAPTASLPAPAGPPVKHRDHLWVLAVIAVCVLIEVWASWIEIGSMSGFPRIGGAHGVSTDWTLAVTTEAYWAYALYAWLAASPGPRSRSFAKWSAGAVFCLSLVGQGAAHLVPPGSRPSPVLVVFVSSLPVLVLALIAILIHLRQADREAAEALARAAERSAREAAELRAEADERTALRAALETAREAHGADVRALREELGAALAARETAEQDAARAEAKAASLARKLGGPASGKPARAAAHAGAGAGRTQLEIARDARLKADEILAAQPDISGAALAEACGMKERWGQAHKKQWAERALGQTG